MLNTHIPLIPQRADPFIYKHSDGYYYFTASVPEYDGIELRRAKTLAGLAQADTRMVWLKPDQGSYSDLIWAPEIHFNQGAWYVYFAAAPSREIKDELFQHRMYAIRCDADNPVTADWTFEGQIDTGIDSFCLDATTFEHQGELYYLWAQKGPGIRGNSNLYIARMSDPLTLKDEPVMLTKPELDWETRGFWVNEGPAVIKGHGRVFISYSASATDENYCVGLLYADENADLMDPASWTKLPKPVFQTNAEMKMFGPGHNSFTQSEEGEDVLVYHARNYTEIEGDPLWDPNRHTFTKILNWDKDGLPVFGKPGQA
ncbi:family 43 glycosylhydrolase [Lacimicrobium alkaliphilum]|uniref:Alpha-N-arabinofuranosidase n=1 Tax=Lacimicrobium alkaliphilum TaxID=1526571 RepID=A0A0U2PJM0_9ALTE|nr:family 43 glycosylhydrolase [Lacimicrobium alkaliphilum]ALS99757.1 alpha-N-arabinofuranosidase [Lacimicrobium alkaliphilum]